MLRIEGNKGSRVVATLLSIAAVMVAWIIAPAPASAAQGGTTTQWTVTGPQGGPFTPTQARIDITNSWNTKLRWYAIGDTSWLRIAGFNGIIKPGQTKSLSVSLQEKAAAGLTKGTYKCQIAFRTPGSGQFHSAADLILIVGDPPPPPPSSGQLAVTPPEGLTSQGTKGGTFSPLAKTYTLANRGSLPVNWKVTFDNDWVTTPGANSGTLQPNTSQDLQVRLDASQLANLPLGQHLSRVRFHDTDTGLEVTSREVVVNVKSASSGVGWTQFTPSSDTRKIYVSSSKGNDGNSGLSEASPKRTIAAGMSLLRDGYPDWLLLKKGDTWFVDNVGNWTRSGRSSSEPMRLASYGAGARPIIRWTRTSYGSTGLYIGSVHDLAITDIEWRPQGDEIGDDPEPIHALFVGSASRLLIEGCLFRYTWQPIVIWGAQDVAVRRNVIVDCGKDGFYVTDTNGLLIAENVLDDIGNPKTMYTLGIYIDNEHNYNIELRDNIISDVYHSFHLRSGGIADGNLIARCGVSLTLGSGDSWSHPTTVNGVTGTLSNNVVLDGVGPGWGCRFENVVGGEVTNNIMANGPGTADAYAFLLSGVFNGNQVKNLSLTDNIVFNWGGDSVFLQGQAGSEIANITLRSNDFQSLISPSYLLVAGYNVASAQLKSSSNRFHSGPMAANNWFLLGSANLSLAGYKSTVGDTTSVSKLVGYPNANNASLAVYHASLGGGASHGAFMTEARKQSRDYWRPEYSAQAVNGWIRAAFGK